VSKPIKWCSTGHIMEDCVTYEELEAKIDEFMKRVSKELGEVTYQMDGKTYSVGLVVSTLEWDEGAGDDEVLN
jgi:hypothetical protein